MRSMWGIEAAGRSKAMSIAVATPAEMNQEALRFHRFTVAEYQRMVDAGAFDRVRVELLDGWIVDKKMHNPPHDFTFNRLNGRLIRMLPGEWVVRNQSAIASQATACRNRISSWLAVPKKPTRNASRPQGYRPGRGSVGCHACFRPRFQRCSLCPRSNSHLLDRQSGQPPRGSLHRSEGGQVAGLPRRSDYAVDESVPLVLDGREIARIPVRELLP